MKKTALFAITSAIAMLSAVSCGRTVRREGENAQAPTMTVQTRPSTEAATEYEPATEAPTEPPTEGRPAKVDVQTKMPTGYMLEDSYVIEGFETVMQNPELPAGCEITALTQTLNYCGFDVDKEFMCDTFMPIDNAGYHTMNDAYLGDPRVSNGFGCNAPVIEKAANDYFAYIDSDWYAIDLTGVTLDDIYYQVEQGRPVVVWSTMDQRETTATFQFILGCGEEFWFNGYQHCLTVYGFDRGRGVVMCADPLVGNVEYDAARFERIYKNMGEQAVILCGNDETAGIDYTTDEEKEAWLEKNKPKELD